MADMAAPPLPPSPPQPPPLQQQEQEDQEQQQSGGWGADATNGAWRSGEHDGTLDMRTQQPSAATVMGQASAEVPPPPPTPRARRSHSGSSLPTMHTELLPIPELSMLLTNHLSAPLLRHGSQGSCDATPSPMLSLSPPQGQHLVPGFCVLP